MAFSRGDLPLGSPLTSPFLWVWLLFSTACFVYTGAALRWMRQSERGWERLSPEKQRAYAAFERTDRGKRSSLPFLVGGFFFVPIRLLALLVLLLLHHAAFRLLAFCFGLKARVSQEELLPKRKYFARISRLLCAAFLKIFGIVRIHNIWWDGKERLGPDAFETKNIVSNHVSCMDIMFFMNQAGTAFVCKASIGDAPFISWAARFVNCIFVDRDCEKDRRLALHQVVQRMQENSRDPRSNTLAVFPEGTTTNGRCLIPFRRGAFAALTTLQPCVLVYSCGGFHPAYELIPTSYFIALALAAFPCCELTAIWLKPISPPPQSDSMTEEKRVEAFSSMVRRAMWKELRARHPNPAQSAEGEDILDTWDGSRALRAECVAELMKTGKGAFPEKKSS